MLRRSMGVRGALGVIFGLAGLSGGARAQTADLVAAYSFDAGAGTTLADLSGNGNTGTITAATWTTSGKFGGALVFNGSSARVQVPDAASLDLTTGVTLEAWVYPTANQANWRTIVQKQTDSYFMHASSQGNMRPACGGTFTSGEANTIAASAIPLNTWTHLAMSYDGATLRLYVNGTQVASVPRTGTIVPTASPLWIGGNNPYGEYFNGRIDEVRVWRVARSAAQIVSDMNAPLGLPDTSPPGAPGSFGATAVTHARVDLSWTAATDDRGISLYEIERCAGASCSSFAPLTTVTGLAHSDLTVAPSTSYSYRVRARDTSSLPGPYATATAVTPAAPDLPPSAPGGLAASAPIPTRVDLTWSAATDDHGIASYEIERCAGVGCSGFAFLSSTTATSASDGTVVASTSYTYRVRARDSASQPGPFASVTVATPAAPDGTPPGPVSGLTATASSSARVDLAWSAANDNVGVVRYRVERCTGAACAVFSEIGTSISTGYADLTVAPSTTYRYQVRAEDAAGNRGAYSSIATAATPAAPSAIGLVAAYGFDEGSGTVSADASGLGHTATLGGATWIAGGKNGSALSFDGSGARATVADSAALDLTSAATLSAWVYPDVVPSYWRTILHKETDRYYLFAGSGGGGPAGGGTFASGNVNAYAPAALAAGVWTHLATTYDGTTVRLYVGGVLVASAPATGGIGVSASPLSIGGTAAYGEYFDGRIDDVRVYNRALAAAEIQADMNTPVGAQPPVAAPRLVIGAPGAGATVPGSLLSIAYTTTGDLTPEVNHVHFQLDADPMVMDLTFDGAYAMPGVRVGAHTLRGWLVRADHSAIAGSDATPVAFTTVVDASDPTPPQVALTAPAPGASLTGVVTVTAGASDAGGVYGVQFRLDGVNLGTEDLTAPYTVSWNTVTAANGAHVLTAVARDVAGNETTATAVSVTVANVNPNDPSLVGQWAATFTWPMVSVHATLLPTGNVLAWTDYTINSGAQIWRPATGTFVPKTYTPVNLFCAGHAYLPNGTLLLAGGTVDNQDDLGPRDTTFFDPATESWSAGPLMVQGRYYPTTTTLGDGRILIAGGTTTCRSCNADEVEIYDPATNVLTPMAASARKAFTYYPHTYVLPDGRILVAAQDDKAISTQVLNLATQSWTTIDSRIIDGHSSAMYLPGKVMKCGKATADAQGQSAVDTTYVLDMTQGSPAWQATASMAFPRSHHNVTILPDGQVLVTGGGRTTDNADFATAVLEAELWNPVTRTWSTMSVMQTPRLYHSIALLLPDARVLVGGGGRQNGRSQPDPKDQANAEIYSPPYLFRGPRPVITSAPAVLAYGASFPVATPDAAGIASVSLVALGSVTHSFNQTQRFVPLSFTASAGSLTVQAPADGNLAPPGPYMLFLVDTAGVPSVATMVRLPGPGEDSVPPGAPSSLSASGALGSVSLGWGAASDNQGIARYNVHRSTVAGFVPSPANLVGTSTTTGYQDTGLAPGTYRYLVTAQDAAGNVGPPSNEATGTSLADTTPPGAPGSLTATAFSYARVDLTWTAATDDQGVSLYEIERCAGVSCATFTPLSTTTSLVFSDTTVAASTSYSYRVRARDTSNNPGSYADPATAVTPAVPDLPPATPGGLTASATVPTQVNLSWTAATDDHGISLYEIERCSGVGCGSFGPVGTSASTSFADTTVVASTNYTYRVRARDTANQPGPYSAGATVVTPAAPDSTPPGAPSGLGATAASSSRVDLAWTAALDDVGVARYRVERCTGTACATFAEIGTSTSLTYADTTVVPSSTYRYQVRAEDAATNRGPYSNIATATTPALPSVTALVAAYAFDEGSGTTSADRTGLGHTLTVGGAVWTPSGKTGSALSYNGTSARSTVADAADLDLSSAMTLMAWVYPNAVPSYWRTILHKETDQYYLFAGSGGPGPAAGGTFGSANVNAFAGSALPVATWTHLAATYDGTTVRLYVGGALAASAPASGSISASGSPLSIGGTAAYGEYFNGRIDDVRIYSRALTAAEILQDMNTPVP